MSTAPMVKLVRTPPAVELLADPLLSPASVARNLQVSRSLIYALIRKGQLRAVKLGRLPRVRRSELERFVATLGNV